MFVNLNDETLSRSSEVGVLTHKGIGRLLSEGTPVTPQKIMVLAKALVDEFPEIESRAHSQLVAGAMSSYFVNHLPPLNWMFAGQELTLGDGRVDLLWTTFGDFKMLDEIKTGASRTLSLSKTREQVEMYRNAAVDAWGSKFLGIRLISTADPKQSRLVRPDGSTCLLSASDNLKDF